MGSMVHAQAKLGKIKKFDRCEQATENSGTEGAERHEERKEGEERWEKDGKQREKQWRGHEIDPGEDATGVVNETVGDFKLSGRVQ